MGRRCWRGRRARGKEAEAGIEKAEMEKDLGLETGKGRNQETEKGPKLPFRISNHAMVKVDEATVYIIGGYEDEGWTTNKTWIADFSNGFKVKKGPKLKAPRSDHSCAVMEIDGKTILVVVGGSLAKSVIYKEFDVELLDLDI